jgi:hypothetical protein
MRICLFAILAIGCGDDTTGNTAPPDLSVKVLHDLSALNTMCDVAKQDCASGQKCVGMFDSSGAVNGTCVMNGTVAAGMACTNQQSPDTLLDNCVAGFVCDNLFGNAASICRKVCSQDSDCASGEKCGDFLFASAGWGWCGPSCTPFSTATGNCPSGQDCGETVDSVVQPDPNTEDGFFLCKLTGTGGPYATCMKDADCGVNLWCGIIDQTSGAAACLPNCNATTDCIMPPVDAGVSTATCHPLTSQPNQAGYCLAQ